LKMVRIARVRRDINGADSVAAQETSGFSEDDHLNCAQIW
jgi:hypothetical protein